ncbi:MAG: hypothetical protein MUE73_21810, partial [Planctomycetes bacterium]|nr:hypothetical protein [Planctomycetota bacterium]
MVLGFVLAGTVVLLGVLALQPTGRSSAPPPAPVPAGGPGVSGGPSTTGGATAMSPAAAVLRITPDEVPEEAETRMRALLDRGEYEGFVRLRRKYTLDRLDLRGRTGLLLARLGELLSTSPGEEKAYARWRSDLDGLVEILSRAGPESEARLILEAMGRLLLAGGDA